MLACCTQEYWLLGVPNLFSTRCCVVVHERISKQLSFDFWRLLRVHVYSKALVRGTPQPRFPKLMISHIALCYKQERYRSMSWQVSRLSEFHVYHTARGGLYSCSTFAALQLCTRLLVVLAVCVPHQPCCICIVDIRPSSPQENFDRKLYCISDIS